MNIGSICLYHSIKFAIKANIDSVAFNWIVVLSQILVIPIAYFWLNSNFSIWRYFICLLAIIWTTLLWIGILSHDLLWIINNRPHTQKQQIQNKNALIALFFTSLYCWSWIFGFLIGKYAITSIFHGQVNSKWIHRFKIQYCLLC